MRGFRALSDGVQYRYGVRLRMVTCEHGDLFTNRSNPQMCFLHYPTAAHTGTCQEQGSDSLGSLRLNQVAPDDES
jgi:hypothetical protein